MFNKIKKIFHKKYKNTILFEASARIYSPSEEDKFIAKASFEKLKPFLPNYVNLEENYDLMGIAANVCVANRVNKNKQALSGELVKSIAPKFIFKQINGDHNRSNILGVCSNYGYSEFGTDRHLTEEEVDELIKNKDPFNLTLGGYIWRLATGEELAERLEDSNNPLSDNYGKISCSWELGFTDYNIGIGEKDLSSATYITNPEEIEKIHKNLNHFGGSGMYEGKPIFINLLGNVLPMGFALTKSPAAEVSGILVETPNPEIVITDDNKNEKENPNESNASENTNLEVQLELTAQEINLKNNEKNLENISNNGVTASKLDNSLENNETETLRKYMRINKVEDITDELLKECKASAITDFFAEKIKEKGEDYALQVKAKEDAEKKIVDLEADIQNLKTQLDKINAEVATREKAEAFQNRVNTLNEEYELNDEEREVIAEEIKDLDSNAFEKWYKRFSVFAKEKSKAFKRALAESELQKKEVDKVLVSEATENTQEKAKEALASLQVDTNQVIPPNAAAVQETVAQKFAKMFSRENIIIK